MAKKNFKELLPMVKAFAFDVDGVLSSSEITMHPNGVPMRSINTKDGYALQLAVKLGYPVAIITGGKTRNVKIRFRGLGIKDIHMGASKKLPIFESFLAKHNLKAEEVMFMGDDIPDYPVMEACGFPVCPADAVPEIQAISIYTSHKKGGDGCVRDILEQVLKAQGKWMNGEAFGW